MIEVELPDGTILDIDTDDDAVAAAAAQKYLAANAPPTSGVPNGGFLDRLSGRYSREVEEGVQGAAEGIEKMTRPNNTMGGRALGAGQTLLGGLQYAASPVTAAIGAVAGDPVRLAMDQAGAPKWATDMAGNTAEMGAGVFGGQPMVQAGKAVAREAAPILNAFAKTPAPTRAQIKAASKAKYAEAEGMADLPYAGKVSPERMQEFAENTKAKILTDFDEDLHPSVKAAMTSLDKRATSAKDIKDLEKYRRVLGKREFSAYKSGDADTGRLMGVMKDEVDGLMDDVIGGTQMSEARALARKNFMMKDFEDIKKVADDLEGDKSIQFVQRKFSALVQNPKKMQQFSPEQQDLIKKIANTGKIEGAFRYLAPSAGLTGFLRGGLGGALGYSAAGGGVPGAAAAAVIPGTAMAGKEIGNAVRMGRVNKLIDNIARGGPEPTYAQRLAQERAAMRGLGGR